MRKTFRLIGILALAVVICFAVSCGDPDNGNSPCSHTGGTAATCTTAQTCTKCGVVMQATRGHDHASSLVCKRTGCDHQYALGDTGPAGGIIFYVADGEESRPLGFTVQGYSGGPAHLNFSTYIAYYLEAAPENISEKQAWENVYTNDLIPGFIMENPRVIGKGRLSTSIIIARGIDQEYTTPAASSCFALETGDKNDWFLPSSDELNALKQIRGQYGIPNTGLFWSSSQNTATSAVLHEFDDGGASGRGKWFGFDVRAVRAF